MQDLDAIMDSRPEGTEPNEQQQTRDDGRDERGRFAGQAREQAKQDAEFHQKQEGQQVQQTEQADPSKPPAGFIPQQAFDARMAKAEEKWQERYTALEAQLNQFRSQQVQPQQQAAPKQPFADQLFADPEAAISARLQEAISPIAQGQTSIVENFSRMMASDKYGEETVSKAYQDLQSRVMSNPAAMRATYQRIMQSQHPYGELVKWHKEQSALSTYGDDPEAWRTSEREKLKAELLAEMQGGGQPNGQQQAQQQQPQNMPSSFAGARSNGPRATPGFSGPKPLSEIMGGR
jgi:hypothetical protein